MFVVSPAGCLSPEYVSAQQAAWGTGSHFTPSFLLPIEPLTKEVLLAKCCHVRTRNTTTAVTD